MPGGLLLVLLSYHPLASLPSGQGQDCEPQMNQTGIYKAENDQLTGLEAVTFLSNTGGDYEVGFSKGNSMVYPVQLRWL